MRDPSGETATEPTDTGGGAWSTRWRGIGSVLFATTGFSFGARCVFLFSLRDFSSGCAMGTRKVTGVTLPSFQLGKERVTLALPLPASLGTRTGPWNLLPQHRWLSTTVMVIGFLLASWFGNSIVAMGWMSDGIP